MLARKLLVTALCLIALWGAHFLPWRSVDAFVPLVDAAIDLQLGDVYFSKLRPAQPPDSQIVIVNIGRLSREKIARVIDRVGNAGPAVMGLDAFFRQPRDRFSDSLLSVALTRHRSRLILVNELADYDSAMGRFRKLHASHPLFSAGMTQAYANVTADPFSPKTVRSISPAQPMGDTVVPSLALAIAQRVKPAAADRCLERKNAQELIHWRGNHPSYFFVDTTAALDTAQSLAVVKGKVVLLAFIDVIEQNRSLEDLYFTPMNDRYAGKSFPDMYGIVIHANMISMILRGDYLTVLPEWVGMLVAALLCFWLVSMNAWSYSRIPKLALVVSLMVQSVFAVLLIWLALTLMGVAGVVLPVHYPLLVVLLAPWLIALFSPMLARPSSGLPKF